MEKMKNDIYITIFTPTFNRGKLLRTLYESIVRQEGSDNVEWVIVDDGSTDNTEQEVQKFILENKIVIKYFYQRNQGKHIAINNGVKLAAGKYFFIVDSDDELVDGALAVAGKWLNTITDDFAGIGGMKIRQDGSIIGTSFEGRYVDCTSLERRKYHITGDKAEIFNTRLLLKYKFPKIDGENFITEAYIWNKIANDGYKIRWVNEPFVICDYREDGLTKNRILLQQKNYKGTLLYLGDLIKFENNFVRKIAHRASYYRIARGHLSDKEIINSLNINVVLLMFLKLIIIIRKV